MPKLSKHRSDKDSAASATERPDLSGRIDGQLGTLLDLVGEEVNRLDELKELLEFTRSEWSDERGELDNARIELESLRRDLRRQQDELELEREELEIRRKRLGDQVQRHRDRRQRWRDTCESEAGADRKLQRELEEVRQQLAESTAMLETTRDRLREAEASHRDELEQLSNEFDEQFEEAEAYKTRTKELRRELAEALERIEALQQQASTPVDDEDVDSEHVAELEAQVSELTEELDKLRNRCRQLDDENGELASQLAEQSLERQTQAARGPESLESMTWEQRKAAILEQLNREDHEDGYSAEERRSLRAEVERADREIQKRDQEIAELRSLLDHQAMTLGEGFGDGEAVAMGAAGIASLIDADELICEERNKLQAIKAEWEEKLRQAEVELSLERAKLARGRREMEQREAEVEDLKRSLEAQQAAAAPLPDGQPRRRWLHQLGLGKEDT